MASCRSRARAGDRSGCSAGDKVTTPLVFGSLSEARRPTRTEIGPVLVRIVRVTEDGEREVVATGCL